MCDLVGSQKTRCYQSSPKRHCPKRGRDYPHSYKDNIWWHVIYLIDKKRAGEIEFDEVKDGIFQTLKLNKFHKKLKKISQELKKRAKISVK